MLRRGIGLLLHEPSSEAEAINLRRWFVFYVGFMAALAVLVGVSFGGFESGRSGAVGWLLGLYMFYMALCCTFFPAPTAWIVLLMASPVVGLVEPGAIAGRLGLGDQQGAIIEAAATIAVVGMVGAAGTSLANLNEYHIFTFLLRFGKVHKVRDSRAYRAASRYFEMSPFWLMTAVSFLPVPVDVVRWLAISHRDRRDHFALASFVGRFVRSSLLAAAATCLKIGVMQIVVIQAVLIGLVLLRFVPRVLEYRRGRAGSRQ